MSSKSIKQLGILLRTQREKLGLSTRDLAYKAGIDDSTVVRLEQGARAAPRPDVLTRLAIALNVPLADLYTLAGYVVPHDLPGLNTYLRVKYSHFPLPAQAELRKYVEHLSKLYGFDPEGPAHGEDESSVRTPSRKHKKL